MDKKTREHIYLAALLHDIGKFYQRADTGSVSTSKELNEAKGLEHTFLPDYNGRKTHKHCLWTAQFIINYESVFKCLVGADKFNIDNNNLINLASCHHLTNDQLSELGKIIKLADCLSSGMDRDTTEAFKDDQAETNWDAFKRTRMTSILETIDLSNKTIEEKNNWAHLPLSPLLLSKNTFATTEKFESVPDYTALWDNFISEFKHIQANTYKAFTETLLNLLYKYTCTIPASTINFPDVSLYDHLKTTAALSVCLYDNMQSNKTNENPFLLIGADFSGIQSYIYQIVSTHAGKNLKGRSFYLKILSDSIVRLILDRLDLFQANIVYNSGGSFYILAPNTEAIKNKLKDVIKEVEEKLMQSHGTSLFVALDYVEFSENALKHKDGENLSNVWTELFKRRKNKKDNRFHKILIDNYENYFEPIMQGGEAKRDIITGEEFSINEKTYSNGDLMPLKKITSQQIDIGHQLKQTELLVVSNGEIPYWKDRVCINPSELGYFYYFLSEKDVKEKAEQLKGSADKVSVITLNGKDGNCNFLRTVDGLNNIYGLDFYGGNEFGLQKAVTFEDMCDNEGFKRLGVLRMDVDNLGKVFQSGIAPERATLSRYAALSRSFDFFFSGYLNTIWRETQPERTFIIYSGGDDVFIVGAWDACIEIAEKINSEFNEFTCQNPAFSLSGGIAIVGTKFPLMKASKESENEESAAKNHKCINNEKNSLSFMSTPLNWTYEYPVVKDLKNYIIELINNGNLPKSFISKVQQHAVNAKIEQHSIRIYKTYWMLTYDLSRMIERQKNTEAKSLIKNCITEVCGNKKQLNENSIQTNYHALELWAFACRWAELENRSNN